MIDMKKAKQNHENKAGRGLSIALPTSPRQSKKYIFPILRGKNNPNWRGGKIKRTCPVCGTEFDVWTSVKRKFCSKECAHKRVGNKGKKHSEEWKERIRRTLMGHSMSRKTKNKISKANKGKVRSQEFRDKISIAFTGSKHPAWKGGVTPIVERIRKSLKYKIWRQQVFIRDNFTCQKCGQRGGKLHAHHIKYFSKLIQEVLNYLPLIDLYEAAMLYTPLWDVENGITYCEKCHRKIKKGGGKNVRKTR